VKGRPKETEKSLSSNRRRGFLGRRGEATKKNHAEKSNRKSQRNPMIALKGPVKERGEKEESEVLKGEKGGRKQKTIRKPGREEDALTRGEKEKSAWKPPRGPRKRARRDCHR